MFALILVAVALGLVFTPARFRVPAAGVAAVVFLVALTVVLVNRKPLPSNSTGALPPPLPLPAKSRKFDFDQYELGKKDAADPDAKNRIAVTEIRFDQVQVVPGIDAGTIQAIRARLYNDSHQYTLTDYSYYLVVQDCLSDKPKDSAQRSCTTVYDQRARQSLAVPPTQARDIVITIPAEPTNDTAAFKLLGEPRIVLSPVDIRAYH